MMVYDRSETGAGSERDLPATINTNANALVPGSRTISTTETGICLDSWATARQLSPAPRGEAQRGGGGEM